MFSGPCVGAHPRGFPHSEICGSKVVCTSPQLIAACHVLLRRPVPRHPPCALDIFPPDIYLSSRKAPGLTKIVMSVSSIPNHIGSLLSYLDDIESTQFVLLFAMRLSRCLIRAYTVRHPEGWIPEIYFLMGLKAGIPAKCKWKSGCFVCR